MIRADIERIAAAPHNATGAEVGKMARDYLRLLDRVEGELTSHSDAIREGMADARERGIHVGRPMLDIDLNDAIELWAAGYALKAIARKTGIHRSTLRRRLAALDLPARMNP